MHITLPVQQFMTSEVRTISPEASLADAYRVLREHTLSSLPVVEGGRAIGVVSRTDLLRVGQVEARESLRAPLLRFPGKKVGEIMHADPVCVGPDDEVSTAAALLVSRHIHRVLVVRGGKLAGVFSTRDAMSAVVAARVKAPIGDYMSTPVLAVESTASLDQATEKLAEANVSGLVVLEDGRPVGLFTQVEALQAAAEPAGTLVEDVMGYALLCLDRSTSMRRAAAHAHATRARRVIAVEHRHVWGVLTGIDFARAALAGA